MNFKVNYQRSSLYSDLNLVHKKKKEGMLSVHINESDVYVADTYNNSVLRGQRLTVRG